MLKFKTITKAVHKRDLYKFHILINEYGEIIFEKLKDVSGISNTENLYFLLLTELWNEKEYVIEHISQFDDYIDFKLDLIKKESVCLTLTKIKSFPSLADENIDLSILKERQTIHRNEIIINSILIDNFKNEINTDDFKFKIVVPVIKRAMETNGMFYNLTHSSHYAFFIYLVTEKKIYVKSLNIKFEQLPDTRAYSEHNLNSLSEVKIMASESLESISREFRLEFTDSQPLILLSEYSIESRDIKNYILKYASDKSIPVIDFPKNYDLL
ncbi:hypothetical protein [uncultured Clostridium sp.]|jgi:hypothetical protein|uniref:hypothetical protein n=1 Tax=uncultured Clostridium sp. TaxID=59620 RepID=UPI00262D1549|nr:hypothetical protein [uncultured Clostridium sp.]